MKIHEYQGKEIFKKYQINIPKGIPAFSIEEAKNAFDELESSIVAIKAQIHAGGRGKAGGVKLVKKIKDLEIEAKKMMGKVLVTHQTGPQGQEEKKL